MQQQLELQEETTYEIRETLTSVQQEVEVKTRKLKKCYAKFMVSSFFNSILSWNHFSSKALELKFVLFM